MIKDNPIEETTILSIWITNNKTTKYMKQKNGSAKRINRFMTIVDFKTPLSSN